MNTDKFEYTSTGIINAIAYLRDIGDLQSVTDTDGKVNNENAVAWANHRYNKMNKQISTPLSYKDIYGEDEPTEEDNKGFNKPITNG